MPRTCGGCPSWSQGLWRVVGWFLVRRYLKDENAEIDDAVWNGEGDLSLRRGLLTSVISEVVVGLGASLGREAAPKLMGGVSGSVLEWSSFPRPAATAGGLWGRCRPGRGLQRAPRRTLFTAEILVGSLALPVVLPALACSWVATATAWLYLPQHATYVDIPAYHFTSSILVWALLAGPVIGAFASGYIRVVGWVSHHRASGRRILVSLPVVLGALGLIGIAYPQLFGNGKDLAHSAFLGQG